MRKIADLMESRLEEFAQAESRDQGKPVSLARAVDIPRVCLNFRYFASSIITEDSSNRWGIRVVQRIKCTIAPIGWQLTVDRLLIGSWPTISWQSADCHWQSIDCQLTHFYRWQSVTMADCRSTLDWLSVDCRPAVGRPLVDFRRMGHGCMRRSWWDPLQANVNWWIIFVQNSLQAVAQDIFAVKLGARPWALLYLLYYL